MMLRSSSTPLLGSLLPSFSETPNNNNNHHHSDLHKHTPNSIHSIISCTNGGSQDFRKSLFHSPSLADTKSTSRSCSNAFRRVQSEGNLEGLADGLYNVESGRRRRSSCALEAIPSFSVYSFGDDDSDHEEETESDEEDYNQEFKMEDTCNSVRVENLTLEQVRNDVNGYRGLSFEGEGKMYLATGLGVSSIDFADGGGSGGGGSYRLVGFNRDGGDSRALSMEQHYKRILEENPGNALFLRNYAQFLYKTKGDLGAAEEYYSRAILADPKDGEILSQYAKIIWELHRDKKRAANYYERAVQASSDDSHIQASYASFLWDTENDEEDENGADGSRVGQPLIHHGFMASATA